MFGSRWRVPKGGKDAGLHVRASDRESTPLSICEPRSAVDDPLMHRVEVEPGVSVPGGHGQAHSARVHGCAVIVSQPAITLRRQPEQLSTQS